MALTEEDRRTLAAVEERLALIEGLLVQMLDGRMARLGRHDENWHVTEYLVAER